MGWLPQNREHTFKATGRTALITDAPNVYAVFSEDEIAPYLGDFQNGELGDPAIGMRIAEEVTRSMLVRPRVVRRGEALPSDQDADDPEAVPYTAIDSGEVDELLEMWTESIQKAARFRSESAGDGSGEGGKGVGGNAKSRSRAKPRKRSGVAD